MKHDNSFWDNHFEYDEFDEFEPDLVECLHVKCHIEIPRAEAEDTNGFCAECYEELESEKNKKEII